MGATSEESDDRGVGGVSGKLELFSRVVMAEV